MTKDWPCFGAISISFVGKPDIDFSLKAAKMDIMSIPGVGSWLENFIKDTLVWLMVWPTVMHIPILEGDQCVTVVVPAVLDWLRRGDALRAASTYLQVWLEWLVARPAWPGTWRTCRRVQAGMGSCR